MYPHYDDEPYESVDEPELEPIEPWWCELPDDEFYAAEAAFEIWADQEARLINDNPTEA